jgi:gluconate 2-dehydrogenase gamma chain
MTLADELIVRGSLTWIPAKRKGTGMADGFRPSRRTFLLSTVLSLPAIGAGGAAFSAAEAAALAAPDLAAYRPGFFTAPEWTFILAACDRLIPADEEGPGALETNVPIFIDQELNGAYGRADDWYMEGPFEPEAQAIRGFQLPYSPQEIYRRGIKAADAYCRQAHRTSFDALDATARDAVLTGLQKNEVHFADFGEPVLRASQFFGFLLANTREGYLSDPMYGGNKGMGAWKMIGFPGARASFLEWVGQHNVRYPLGPVSILGERA